MRVQFIHGLESSPRSRKAQVLADHFDTLSVAMDTSDFEACVALQSEAVAMWGPEVLIGSSFGGAVATALLQRELWRGSTLLLATATLRRGMPATLPSGVAVHLVHATKDEVVPIGDAHQIAEIADPEWVRFDEVDDDHALTEHVKDGSLVRWVRALAER